jgi:copper(I)-binding protein
VAIAPGGYHIMLEHAQHKVAPGDTVHLSCSSRTARRSTRRSPSSRRPRRTDA